MDKRSVRQFLECLGADRDKIRIGEEWAKCPCPFAPWTHKSGTDAHPSFAVHYTKSRPSFNCFSCKSGLAEDLPQLLRVYGAKPPLYDLSGAIELLEQSESIVGVVKDILDTTENRASQYEKEIPWPENWLNSFMPAMRVVDAKRYLLKSRGILRKEVEYLDIRWDSSREAVCFPVRNWDGNLCGLRGRYVNDTSVRYHDYSKSHNRNKNVWFGEHLIDVEKPVVLVESVFDLAKVVAVYRNVLAPLSVGINKPKALRIEHLLSFITFFDADEGGDKGRRLMSRYLGGQVVQHLRPVRDGEDPADMPYSEIRSVLGASPLLTGLLT